jgi:hypothetical protein
MTVGPSAALCSQAREPDEAPHQTPSCRSLVRRPSHDDSSRLGCNLRNLVVVLKLKHSRVKLDIIVLCYHRISYLTFFTRRFLHTSVLISYHVPNTPAKLPISRRRVFVCRAFISNIRGGPMAPVVSLQGFKFGIGPRIRLPFQHVQSV